jgi:ribonuclease BN (tRNA processing enzyme)
MTAAAGLGPDRLVLLGTKGGPAVRIPGALPTSNLLVVAGTPYVIDAGYGVSLRLVEEGIPLSAIRTLFITHHHSDHNLEAATLLYNAWVTGLREPVAAYGPTGMHRLFDGFWQSQGYDIDIRIADEGRPDLRRLVRVVEFGAGEVLHTDAVTVRALRVEHPPVTETYALRFDFPDKSIVFSADTAYFPPLAEFARGADILVHEAMHREGLERLCRRVPNAPRLREHLIASHTFAEDVGRLAEDAGVPRLVLNHFVPADDAAITPADWIAAVGSRYKGELTIGRDRLSIML